MTTRGFPVAMAFVLLAAVRVASQHPTFHAGTNTVSVPVTVNTRDGQIITGLEQKDFEILADGKRREITVFARETQPLTAVIVLDGSSSMDPSGARMRDAATAFIMSLRDSDRARLSGLTVVDDVFTNDRAALIQRLRMVGGDYGSPVWNGVDRAMTSVAKESGRRVILLFSDGEDTNEHPPIPSDLGPLPVTDATGKPALGAPPFEPEKGFVNQEAASRRAEREGFTVFSVGFEGQAFHFGAKAIGLASGGGYVQLKRSAILSVEFSRVAAALRHQYVLGFVPEKVDGKEHEIEVRVKQPGMTARARKTYVAK